MKHIKTRIFSFLALAGMLGGCGYVGHEGYWALMDSWVAPAILSPDNDLVVDAKLKLSSVLLEKGKAQSELAESDADIEAAEKAIIRLNELKDLSQNALNWSKTTTAQQVQAGGVDLKTLAAQKAQLDSMLSQQSKIVSESKQNLEVGLIPKEDYEHEEQALNQINLALFDNDRARIASELLSSQAAMANTSLRNNSKQMLTDGMMLVADMQVRIETQLLASEAELRSKMAARLQLKEELEKIEVLEEELHARPIFKAIDQNLDIAFAPYSSLRGIATGARLMDCAWGVFNCHEVGRVVGVIAGETILPDIFGSGQTRGQFITLNLMHHTHDEAMQSKVLRIRTSSSFAAWDSKVASGK